MAAEQSEDPMVNSPDSETVFKRARATIALKTGAQIQVEDVQGNLEKFAAAYEKYCKGQPQDSYWLKFNAKKPDTTPGIDRWILLKFESVVALLVEAL